MKKRHPLGRLVALALSFGTAVTVAAGATPPGSQALVTEIPLPGGIAALLRAVDAPGSADPATAMLAFVRAVHAGRTGPAAKLLAYFDAARGQSVRTDMVPLPLSPEVWTSAVLRRKVPRSQLADAIFSDQKASLVYHGLMALDDETLAYIESHPAVLSAIAARSAGAFAEWGRSVHVRNGRLQFPGGQQAAALWEGVVGQAETDWFIQALFARDSGRAAFLYDTVAHLEPARQAFALGGALHGDRLARFKALYGAFTRTTTFDSSLSWPVVRHPVSPGAVLARVLVDDDGRMAAPSSRAFWEAAFAGNVHACSSLQAGSGEVDAAWLTDRIERQFAEKRAEWLAAITLAQRVFGRAKTADLRAACEVVASFPRHQALVLTLERMRIDDPADYLAAARFADRLWSGADRRAAVVATAQAQGVLVILERAFSARVIDAAAVRRLAISLLSLRAPAPGAPSHGPGAAPAEGALPPGAIGAWMRSVLLPGLCKAELSPDACLIRAVSGEGPPGSAARVVRWEDQDYRVDLGAATAARLRRIRQVQKATAIDDALTLQSVAARLSDSRADAEEVRRQVSILKALMGEGNLDLGELFGHGIPRMRAVLQSAATRLASNPGAAERAEVAWSLAEVGDLRLADALVSFAYAVGIGEPDDAVLMGGDPSRQHRFDATIGPATGPWHLPEEVQATDQSWLMEGSVLALHTVFAKSWLRRLSIQDPGMRPRPEPQDVRAFGESEAIFNAFNLTDGGRDAIVAAIRRGRARWAELLGSPESLWAAAAKAGISEWRCRAAQWVASRAKDAAGEGGPGERATPADYVSLSEFMWLGAPDLGQDALDAWGVSVRTTDGSLLPRMPSGHAWEDVQGPRGVGLLPAYLADVHLRAAEMLAELGLPASLAPGITSYVVWDVMTAAEMAHPDDWLALVRATRKLPADRTFDYVSTLTATGPLVPRAAF